MLKVFVVERSDEVDWDEYDEVTVVAESKERAIEMVSSGRNGFWDIVYEIDLSHEQLLTESYNAG